jgi:hypothetical protein
MPVPQPKPSHNWHLHQSKGALALLEPVSLLRDAKPYSSSEFNAIAMRPKRSSNALITRFKSFSRRSMSLYSRQKQPGIELARSNCPAVAARSARVGDGADRVAYARDNPAHGRWTSGGRWSVSAAVEDEVLVETADEAHATQLIAGTLLGRLCALRTVCADWGVVASEPEVNLGDQRA